MLPARGLLLVASTTALFPAAFALRPCSFVYGEFTCTRKTLDLYAYTCALLTCEEVDGVGKYECTSGGVTCGADYDNNPPPPPSWSVGTYVGIGILFVVVSVVVYGALYALARRMRGMKNEDDKKSDSNQSKSTLAMKAYAYAYNWAFGSLYKPDSSDMLTLGQFWIAGCELLDCFWCCSNRKRGDDEWRPFYTRLMRLVASLSVGASLGMMFGSLEYDSIECHKRANLYHYKSGGTSTDKGYDAIYCASAPDVYDPKTLVSAASIVAFVSTQCVKYVGSYAQSVGKPQTTLDVMSHVVWLVVALVAFPVCYAISSSLMSTEMDAGKADNLRWMLVINVTLSTWIKDQGVDLVKMPFIYSSKKFWSKCFATPPSSVKNQSVEPMPHELAPPKSVPTDRDNGISPQQLQLSEVAAPPQPTS